MTTNHDGDYDNCDDQVTSNAVCPLQAGKRWTGWTEGNLPSWYGLRPRRIHHHHVYVSSSHSFILITVILIVSISSAPPLFSIKIFILQVVSFFFFHLFLPFESVTFIFLDSWHSMMFLLPGQHRADKRRLQRQLRLQVFHSDLSLSFDPTDSRREEDEQIFCFASGGFPVESCPADQIWTNKPIFVPAILTLRWIGIDITLTHNHSWRPETVWPY